MPQTTLITLLGQTSSGKSEMAVSLAKKLGEAWVVNCDSRQIYRGLNIGTGKVEGKWVYGKYIYKGIQHHLIDFVDPKKRYSLKNFLLDFNKVCSTPNIPKYIILTGGTGMYADSIINKYELANLSESQEKQFQKTKKELEQLDLETLQNKYNSLKNIRPNSGSLNNSDFHNLRRLVNWLMRQQDDFCNADIISIPEFRKTYNFAIKIDQDILKKKITSRLEERFSQGLMDEVNQLDLSSDRLNELGLEYKIVSQYLSGDIDKDGIIPKLKTANISLAKKQKTWLKKRDLIWVKSEDEIMDYIK